MKRTKVEHTASPQHNEEESLSSVPSSRPFATGRHYIWISHLSVECCKDDKASLSEYESILMSVTFEIVVNEYEIQFVIVTA